MICALLPYYTSKRLFKNPTPCSCRRYLFSPSWYFGHVQTLFHEPFKMRKQSHTDIIFHILTKIFFFKNLCKILLLLSWALKIRQVINIQASKEALPSKAFCSDAVLYQHHSMHLPLTTRSYCALEMWLVHRRNWIFF